jgi:hypothetical protein
MRKLIVALLFILPFYVSGCKPKADKQVSSAQTGYNKLTPEQEAVIVTNKPKRHSPVNILKIWARGYMYAPVAIHLYIHQKVNSIRTAAGQVLMKKLKEL